MQDAGAEYVKRDLLEVVLHTGVTSQLSGMTLAAKGFLASVCVHEQNCKYYPKSKLDGGKNVNTTSTLRFPPAKVYVFYRRVHMNIRKRGAALGSPSNHENLGR